MTDFLLELAGVGGVAAVAWLAGGFTSRVCGPADRLFLAERIAWSWALGAAILASMVPLSFLAHVRPGWPAFLALSALSAAGAWIFRVRKTDRPRPPDARLDSSAERVRLFALLGAFAAVGVGLYLMRALTEPMWSNDYVAIWGLKGKTIHASGAVPSRLPIPRRSTSRPLWTPSEQARLGCSPHPQEMKTGRRDRPKRAGRSVRCRPTAF